MIDLKFVFFKCHMRFAMTLKLLMQNTSVEIICRYFDTKSNLKHTSGTIFFYLQAKCELIKSNDVPNTLKHTAIAPCKRYNASFNKTSKYFKDLLYEICKLLAQNLNFQ